MLRRNKFSKRALRRGGFTRQLQITQTEPANSSWSWHTLRPEKKNQRVYKHWFYAWFRVRLVFDIKSTPDAKPAGTLTISGTFSMAAFRSMREKYNLKIEVWDKI